MKRNIVETVIGALVLVIALSFLFFGLRMANVGGTGVYNLYANFVTTGGLGAGDTVSISGVKVGTVSNVSLDDNYFARVDIALDKKYELPVDTAATISSESLLGGRFLSLEPGADEELIPEGGRIQYTQAPQNLEQLLGKFIFSMQDGKKDGEAAGDSAGE